MFQGTLPNKVLKVVNSIVKEWDVKRIYVGCSGNFTIERTISDSIGVPITSNDVTIYSSYLGKYFAGEELGELKVVESYDGVLNYLRDYMNTDTEKVATMILAADILPFEANRSAYDKRMLRAWKEQYQGVHESLCKKLEKVDSKVDSFYHGDVMNMLDEIEDGCGFISFPPFFKGGYETMWKNIAKFFEYEAPDYVEFDPNVHVLEFCNKVKRLDNFLIATERVVPEFEEYSSGISSTKNKEIYFYSKSSRKHYTANGSKETVAKPIPRIGPEERITENLYIKEINVDQFMEIRALYLSTAVTKTGTPTKSYGLFSEGKLFGVFAFSTSNMLGSSAKLEKPTMYLLTDFSVVPTIEKNLSKLVLYCVLSKESRILAEKVMGKQVNSIATNAFSKNPTSMKYRGLFDLYGRKVIEKNEDGTPKKYNLSYGAPMGQWTLKEAYELWRRKS